MDWTLAPSLVTLRNQINATWPNRSKASDGTIGDAAHGKVPSDHNPNSAGVVCALDVTHDPANGFNAHALADILVANRHPQLKYVISNSRIAGPWTGWKWTAYYGSNKHDKHIHVSVGVGDDGKSQPGSYESNQRWTISQEENMSKATQEDVYWLYYFVEGIDLTPEQVKATGKVGQEWEKAAKEIIKYVSDNKIAFAAYRKWAEAEIAKSKLTQDVTEKIVSRAYRAATDVDPTSQQAGYWVPRIKQSPNEINNLLDGLGAKDYKGDAAFRSKARNYDADVKKAAEGNEAANDLQTIKDILKK